MDSPPVTRGIPAQSGRSMDRHMANTRMVRQTANIQMIRQISFEDEVGNSGLLVVVFLTEDYVIGVQMCVGTRVLGVCLYDE